MTRRPLLSRRRLHVGLAAVPLIALLPVAPVAAATKPLGFTLGQTTLGEVAQSLPDHSIKGIARSGATGGPRIEIDPAAFDFDGLEKVLLVFDADKRLIYVQLTIAKRRFHDVLADLRSKYSVQYQNIDNFMQNGDAEFRFDNDWIIFQAPHLSFSLELSYATDSFWREALRRGEELATQKRQQERGKL
ncbi:MAG: hypothetical protein WAS21_08095 [Geminicoccaceae bacterium]